MRERNWIRVYDKKSQKFLESFIVNYGDKRTVDVFYNKEDFINNFPCNDNVIIERCTGVKDCSGFYIYYGDIVEYKELSESFGIEIKTIVIKSIKDIYVLLSSTIDEYYVTNNIHGKRQKIVS